MRKMLVWHLTKNIDKVTAKQNKIIILYLFRKNAYILLKLWANGQNTPEFFYWLIYSLNYTHLLNQYLN